jgi:hypothetical protein
MRTLALLISNLALVACNMSAEAQEDRGPRSAGPAVTRSFDLAGFDAVGSAGSQDVIVTVGGAHAVRAEGDADSLERLELRVEDGTLKIGHKKGNWSVGWSRDRPRTVIYVTLPAIRAASVAGSGDMKIDRVQGDEFAANIAGSGDIEVGQLRVASLNFSVAGSGNIKAGRLRAEWAGIRGRIRRYRRRCGADAHGFGFRGRIGRRPDRGAGDRQCVDHGLGRRVDQRPGTLHDQQARLRRRPLPGLSLVIVP